MQMLRKFESISHSDTHGYAYDTDGWSSDAQLHTNFRMFQTYGDGLCQHSSDWPVTKEFTADYLLSLAAAMLADVELADYLLYRVSDKPSDDSIAFAASVVFKAIDETHSWEKKTRYFSVSEKKITSSDTKQYDKRYQRVESWCDGKADAIYRMLIPEYSSGLERLQYATAIRDWLMRQENGWMELPARFLKWTESNDTAREIMHALESAQYVVESTRLRHAAESNIASTRRNLESAKAQAAVSEVA